jgi:hypothetical protein
MPPFRTVSVRNKEPRASYEERLAKSEERRAKSEERRANSGYLRIRFTIYSTSERITLSRMEVTNGK